MVNKRYKIADISKDFKALLHKEVIVSGRISSVRKMKETLFIDVSFQGFKIQISANRNHFNNFASGDLIEVSGECLYSKKGEPTICASKITLISRWCADSPLKNIKEIESGPLFAFLPETYKRLYFSNAVRNYIRDFLSFAGYFEVQTPILSKKYNGGKSFPVTSSYHNEKIGFSRTTMEDRMQAVIASGFEKIFQIGSIFRSSKENTFLEGYAAFIEWNEGKQLIKDMLSEVVGKLVRDNIGEVNKNVEMIMKKDWQEIDFFVGAKRYFGIKESELKNIDDCLLNILNRQNIITGLEVSPETVADKLANAIAQKQETPTIVSGFPDWSSPLYSSVDSDLNKHRLQRARVYLPGQHGGFELGMQENNYNLLKEKIARQRNFWKLSSRDFRTIKSDLEIIISGGTPPMFGFALSPDRIIKIWRNDCSIDPFR